MRLMAPSLEAIQKILQETVAPGISDLRERLTRVEVENRRLDDKLTTAIEIRERLAALEAKVAAR